MSAEDEESTKALGRYGFNSREAENAARDILGNDSHFSYRPLERLRNKDISEIGDTERLPIVDTLKDMVLEQHLSLAQLLGQLSESYKYKKTAYTVEHYSERAASVVTQLRGEREMALPGQNERLLGLVEADLLRVEAGINIFSYARYYKEMYWSGMDSMAAVSERGEQLALANMARLTQGIKAKWLTKEPEGVSDIELAKWRGAKDYLPLTEGEETISDRYGRYESDADFWLRAIGEMNTYNPTVQGEKLYLSKTTQMFLGQMLRRVPRMQEDGTVEKIKDSSRVISVYLDPEGNQIPLKADGTPKAPLLPRGTTKNDAYINVLDPYNKARSEVEMRWVISTITSMSILNAKGVLDTLPENIQNILDDENNESSSKYNDLFNNVKKMALSMMDDYDMPKAANLNQELGRSAYYLADAVAFGTFDIAERGFSYEWKLVKDEKTGDYYWSPEPGQGDPTASGDAFTAARPYFHEVVYQAVKNRISSNNSGVSLPVDSAEGQKMATVYASECAEANDRTKILEILKKGVQQQHLVKYFGILGAFKNELGNLPAWKEGESKRNKLGKHVNPNLSKSVEELVVFVPTPFENATDGKLLYPMIAHQFKTSLYDMLSASKGSDNEHTVADLLRRTWKKDDSGKLVEADPKDGGKRLTHRDINWLMYARYADDSRAVNNNFMLQLYAPLYGALNPKSLDVIKNNPAVAITASIKAADIGLRWVIRNFKNPTVDAAHPENDSGTSVKRPTLEIMHAASIVFQQLALGHHGLIGRDAVARYEDFVTNVQPGEDMKQNLYTSLRNIEDFIPTKQGYKYYSDSFFLAFLAMTEAIKPITIASDSMAYRTTKRFDELDPTGIAETNKLASNTDREQR